MDSTICIGSSEQQTALLTMDDASELRDNANVTIALLLSASELAAAEDYSIDQRVNNVAQNFWSSSAHDDNFQCRC